MFACFPWLLSVSPPPSSVSVCVCVGGIVLSSPGFSLHLQTSRACSCQLICLQVDHLTCVSFVWDPQRSSPIVCPRQQLVFFSQLPFRQLCFSQLHTSPDINRSLIVCTFWVQKNKLNRNPWNRCVTRSTSSELDTTVSRLCLHWLIYHGRKGCAEAVLFSWYSTCCNVCNHLAHL